MHAIEDPILTEEEYRAWVKLSAPTTQRQRSDGSGPPFVQLSERRIGYRKSAVEQWLETRTISHVGALTSAEQPLQPATKVDAAKAAPPIEPASRRRERGW
jgi:predicted DNA-binding transcriptional regulator AlpA